MLKLLKHELYALICDRLFVALLVGMTAALVFNAVRTSSPEQAGDISVLQAAMLGRKGFVFLGVILTAYFLCRDFENRTYINALCGGFPRELTAAVKLLCYYAIAAIASLLTSILAICCLAPEVLGETAELVKWLAFRVVTDWGLISFIAFLAAVIKKTAPTVCCGAVYSFAVSFLTEPREETAAVLLVIALLALLLTSAGFTAVFRRAEF